MAKFITLDNLKKFKKKCDDEYKSSFTIPVDDTPTDGSENLVTSGGVKKYTDEIIASNLETFKENCDSDYMPTKEIDTAPTEDSENLVTSGGVRTYVDATITEAINTSITRALGGDY